MRLAIWFNHEDRGLRPQPIADLSMLKQFGFTDAYILAKGIRNDIRSNPEWHNHLSVVVSGIKEKGIKAHGMYICSLCRSYLLDHPGKGDVEISGHTSDVHINHTDLDYIDYMLDYIVTTVEEYSFDGVQFDYMRYNKISNGWGREEEAIYSSCGVNVSRLKADILSRYNTQRGKYIVSPERFYSGEPDLIALSEARSNIIHSWLHSITNPLRNKFPGIELSAALMPAGLCRDKYHLSEMVYGQKYEDFSSCLDTLIPMAYLWFYGKTPEWVSVIGREALKRGFNALIGLDCGDASLIGGEIRSLEDFVVSGLSFFRYGRIVLAVREDGDTIIHNTYPGLVESIRLYSNSKEQAMDCQIAYGESLRIRGHWDQIQTFGRYLDGGSDTGIKELCTVGNWQIPGYEGDIS
ncbi:hypothetical protein SAMN02910292_00877 [Lachnospiraceae bacterium XBB2008]|nr:hypothetical protein SAMN02910292_00877 [Lachnospiraceae bacterium XBB2008]